MAVDPTQAGYLLAFGATALACFGGSAYASRIEDPETRRGIRWLLLLSGAWAAAHLGFLVAPTAPLQTASYLAGLVVGFAAVGPWLYFCSAYSGRSIHRNRTVQSVAIGVLLAVVALKVTNPLHGLYFSTAAVTAPFPHLAVTHGVLHWLVMGLSYALAFVGYFMLLELFLQVSYDTKPLVVLLAVTAVPLALDVIGVTTEYLLDITHEPIGVGVFAVGVLAVYLDRFQAIQIAGQRDEPVFVVTADDVLRDFNASAAEAFPGLDRTDIGRPFAAVVPDVAAASEADMDLLGVTRGDDDRFYRLTASSYGGAGERLGRIVSLADVTHLEEHRRELERQNDRLEQFAGMLSHDLRNPLTVAAGRLELAQQERDSEHLTAMAEALARMSELIDDVLTLARLGEPIAEEELVDLASIAQESWQQVETADAELVIDDDLSFMADATRLKQLLENLFRNAVEHAGPGVTVRIGATAQRDGFSVADDGPGIPDAQRERVLESGYTTTSDGTGFGLAIVREIAEAHGWHVTVSESEDGGARFEFGGLYRGTTPTEERSS